jgi:replicative DNA helicase Mcm
MLEPMSKQSIAVSKAGINTKLQTRVAVIAAANPKHGRFDPFEPVAEQFVFGSAMMSRFDLVFTFNDEPDPETDAEIVGHIADHRRAGKLGMRGDLDADDAAAEHLTTTIDHDTLRKWVALASRTDPPVEDRDALDSAKETFTSLRAANGYAPDDPVPVTFRKFEAVLRLAEAAAKFEFADRVEQRHFEVATDLVGQSMQDVGKNEDDEFDADVVETGTSKPQADRKKVLEKLIRGLADGDAVEQDVLIEEAGEHGIGESNVRDELQWMKDHGWIIEPTVGETVKWLGRA